MNQKLVFVITSGRSGTGFLCNLLRHLPNVKAFHEPEPGFHEVMRAVQSNPDLAKEFWLNQKLPAIKKNKEFVYIETSHLFCKGFIEPLLNIGIQPKVIILTRKDRDVAKSMYELNTIPGRTELGLQYYLAPFDPVFLPIPNWNNLTDYQLCFWYAKEIEKRQEVYLETFTKIGEAPLIIDFAQLISGRALNPLIKFLNIRHAKFYEMIISKFFRKKYNAKKSEKVNLCSNIAIEAEECEVLKLIRAL